VTDILYVGGELLGVVEIDMIVVIETVTFVVISGSGSGRGWS
jgi:hypothetical protein